MNQKQTVGELVYKISGDMDNLKTELKNAETSIDQLSKSANSSTKDIKNLDNTIDALNKRAKELKATMSSSIIGSEQFKKASADLDKVNAELKKAEKNTDGFGSSIKKALAGLGILYILNQLKQFAQASLQAYANAQQSLLQFNNAQQNVAGTTKEQINDLNDYINLLEEKTSVDDKSIRQASQILAQDQIKIENQKKLLAGIVDIAVANSKANGGEVDASGTAMAIGRAMATGNLGALTRQNIVGIDEARAKAFQLGNEAQRTAIMMQLLAENGKGAGEALGSSFQGQVNKAKDTLEEFQVALGRGLVIAGTEATTEMQGVVSSFDDTRKAGDVVGEGILFLTLLLSGLVKSVTLVGKVFVNVAKIFGESIGMILLTTGEFAVNIVRAFKTVGENISKVGKSIGQALTGNFKEAKETFDSIDFNIDWSYTKKGASFITQEFNKMEESTGKLEKSIGSTFSKLGNLSQTYKSTGSNVDQLAAAQDALKKKTEGATQATEDQKKASEDLKGKVLDLKNKVDELVQSIGDKLTEATTKFKDSVKDIVTDSTKSFSDIVVNAEKEITDLKKQLTDEQAKSADQQSADNIKKLNSEIAEKQKILTSYANFQNDLNTEIARVQAELDKNNTAAKDNTDPNKQAKFDATSQGLQMQIDALKGFQDLDKQVAEARKLAGEDDFKQAEINTFAKIQLATNLFIDETTKLREKQAVAIQVEQSVTDFYKQQTLLRQKTLDAFATSSIATMKKIGDEAKSALSALNSLRSAGAQIDMPVNTIQTPTINGVGGSATSSSTTNNTKNVNTPVTINANIGSNVDATQIAKELAWQISQK